MFCYRARARDRRGLLPNTSNRSGIAAERSGVPIRYPPKVLAITASYTESTSGVFDAYECGATLTLTLKSPAQRRRVFVINTGSGVATIATEGTSATFNGASTLALSNQYDGVELIANGLTGSDAAWRVAGSYTASDVSLANGKILVGNSSGVPTAVTPSGDVTITNAGVTAIGSAKVTNAMEAVPKLVYYQETCPVTSFTDGGGTSGTLVLAHTIPAGAVYVRSTVHGLTGFAGDTSAAATLGDGSDVDRYNTGTPTFFTTQAAGVDMGVPSGTLFHSAAIATVTLTVTTGADFTTCKSNAAGSVIVTLVYHRPV